MLNRRQMSDFRSQSLTKDLRWRSLLREDFEKVQWIERI